MTISQKVKEAMQGASWVRRMFEAATQLKLQYGEEGIFDFSLGNPVQEPPQAFKDALKMFALNPVEGMHRYMPNSGYVDTRRFVAELLSAETGIPFTEDHIVMTVGAAGGMNVALKAILDPGDEVIVPSPYFVEFGFYIDNHGGNMRLVDTREDFSLDLAAIDGAITERTKAVIINSPNNPTGVVYEEEKLKELASLLSEYRKRGNKIYIISDDAYRKLVFDDIKLPNIFKIYDLVISATSHSKDLALPGERIGYIAISPTIKEVKSLVTALMFSSRALGFVNAPALFQRVIGKFQKNSVDIMDYQQKRDLIYNTLIEAGFECVKPRGAFYAFPKSPMKDELKFVKIMQEEERILVVPGRGFGKPGYFRIAYCVPFDKIERAVDGFKNIGKRYIKKG